ncbi:unnamed protein product [Arctogadus glacialis]
MKICWMSSHLIRFANGDIAVVPDKWCDDGMVYWPKYKNTERAKRAAANTRTMSQTGQNMILRSSELVLHYLAECQAVDSLLLNLEKIVQHLTLGQDCITLHPH